VPNVNVPSGLAFAAVVAAVGGAVVATGVEAAGTVEPVVVVLAAVVLGAVEGVVGDAELVQAGISIITSRAIPISTFNVKFRFFTRLLLFNLVYLHPTGVLIQRLSHLIQDKSISLSNPKPKN